MIIATAGHVDHGKTALVHQLTGIKTDRLAEEKTRGLTIDLGFAYIYQGSQTIGFIDVPGHIKFINNMLAGITAVDYAMLVIAADDGVMPQTREHLAILDLMGIDQGCIVITKTDRVDETRLNRVQQDIQALLANKGLAKAPIFRVSNIDGSGIEALKKQLWQAATEQLNKSANGLFRLAIDRCFIVKGAGIVVTGSVFSGNIRINDELILHPQKKVVRVRAIHRQNQPADTGSAGDRCAINLTGDISRDQISRGNWLSANGLLPYSNRLDVNFKLLSTETSRLKHWTPVHIHSAAQHATGRIAILESNNLLPGETQLVQLVLSTAMNTCYGDHVIIRDQSANRTLGGGRVIDPDAPRHGRTKPARVKLLKTMLNPVEEERFTNMLSVYPDGFNQLELKAKFNLVSLNVKQYGISDSAGQLLGHRAVKTAKTTLLNHLDGWHKTNTEGISAPQLIVNCELPVTLANCAINQLLNEKNIIRTGNNFSLPGTKTTLTEAELTLWQKVEPILQQDILRPPVIHDLAKSISLAPALTDKLLSQMIKYGLVTRPTKNRFFLPEAITTLKKIAIELADKNKNGHFTVIEFRDHSGIGRNLSIQILEFFDQTGFTRRLADHRIIQDPTR
ncbi:MAG: selenocysteine-specific translation elongation factor [Pseudomonadales bacterium]|nr:selenocysteine-specific translation elongation factor [Pseudomonadales bacterium]